LDNYLRTTSIYLRTITFSNLTSPIEIKVLKYFVARINVC
jgi:hypothetical protein